MVKEVLVKSTTDYESWIPKEIDKLGKGLLPHK